MKANVILAVIWTNSGGYYILFDQAGVAHRTAAKWDHIEWYFHIKL